MFQANPPVRPNRIPGTLELEISDPVLLLNEIARRYETPERVLMEYVDNALDDAEAMYRDNDNRYPYPITIKIDINFAASEVTITDNCRGMSRQLLERVVKNIGESQKRGVTWVNGRFGFGVQAFRAAAGTIQFFTKQRNSSAHVLELQREQHYGIKEAKRVDDAFPTNSGTGTIVTISGFDPAWSNFSVESVRAEIESHFERLTARPDLSMTVGEVGQPTERCLPFDYAGVAGEAIRQTLEVEHKGEIYPIEVHLIAASESVPQRAARFFVRGRRINDVAQIKSFMRKSKHKTRLWGHPHLLGYIEVGELVQPAITRDDFDRTRGRQLCYETMLTLEPELNKLLRRVNKAGHNKTLTTLETAVNQAITLPQPATKGEPPAIQFVPTLPGAAKQGERATQHDNVVFVNVEHPDFKARLAYNRQGLPKITDRLNAYLACVISAQYFTPDVLTGGEPHNLATLLQTQMEKIIELEAMLHSQATALRQAIAKK